MGGTGGASGVGREAEARVESPSPWGGSSAGRASRSQCEGREFDPPPLHQEFNARPKPVGRFHFQALRTANDNQRPDHRHRIWIARRVRLLRERRHERACGVAARRRRRAGRVRRALTKAGGQPP